MKAFLNDNKVVLVEGAIVERLKSEFNIPSDPHINYGGAIYDHAPILENIYRQYIEIGKKHDLPMILMTSTRRSHESSIAKSAYAGKSIIADNCKFVEEIRNSYGDYSRNIKIGGIMGCIGDAYSAKESLGELDAYNYHRKQSHQFTHVDFLFAAIMPEINEALGMAKAMAETGKPYMISFMLRKDGCLLDGTKLVDAIELIDSEIDPKPLAYMTNCIHPANLLEALEKDFNANNEKLNRFIGIQANASRLSPEELDENPELQQDDFDVMSDLMIKLHEKFEIKLLGGCCGTNDHYISTLAKRIKLLA